MGAEPQSYLPDLLPTTETVRPRESANLDLLRAVAVGAVFATHVLATLKLSPPSPMTRWDLGRLGVLLFFVHTSLVLMQSLERLKLDGVPLMMSFALRRIVRIYPLSILFVVFATAVSMPASPWKPAGYVWMGWFHLASNLALTQNLTFSPSAIGPLWSLPYELQMYALLPLIFLLVRARPTLGRALGLWGASVVLALIQPSLGARFGVAEFGPCFIAGTIAYVGLKLTPARLPSWLWPVALVGSAAVFLAGPRLYSSWLFCLTVGMAIPHFREITTPWLRRVSALVAKYSYGIYLSHPVALWVAFRVAASLPAAAHWSILIGLSVLLPVASFHLIEQPFIVLGKTWADRRFHTPRLVPTVLAPASTNTPDPAPVPVPAAEIRLPAPPRESSVVTT